MSVVIKNASKGVIFGHDGWTDKFRILNLETHFKSKSFDIKVLDNGGVDIAATGSPFISDIVFTDIEQKDKLSLDYYKEEQNNENYINMVDEILKRDYPHRKYPRNGFMLNNDTMTTVNYEDPINWALTFKMRGFDDVLIKPYPRGHPMMNSYTASGLLKAIKRFRKNYNEHIKIKPSIKVQPRHMSIFMKHYMMLGPYTSKMCIYIEHEFVIPTELEVKERTLSPEVPACSKIFDFYSNGSMYGTMIGVSISPYLNDYVVHSDEGYYTGGVNYYNKKRGIVLLGEQNSNMMYYGNAMYHEIYVPDVFFEFKAQTTGC